MDTVQAPAVGGPITPYALQAMDLAMAVIRTGPHGAVRETVAVDGISSRSRAGWIAFLVGGSLLWFRERAL